MKKILLILFLLLPINLLAKDTFKIKVFAKNDDLIIFKQKMPIFINSKNKWKNSKEKLKILAIEHCKKINKTFFAFDFFKYGDNLSGKGATDIYEWVDQEMGLVSFKKRFICADDAESAAKKYEKYNLLVNRKAYKYTSMLPHVSGKLEFYSSEDNFYKRTYVTLQSEKSEQKKIAKKKEEKETKKTEKKQRLQEEDRLYDLYKKASELFKRKNHVAALRNMLVAADAGSIDAISTLANWYSLGAFWANWAKKSYPVDVNYNKAFHYACIAAFKGDTLGKQIAIYHVVDEENHYSFKVPSNFKKKFANTECGRKILKYKHLSTAEWKGMFGKKYAEVPDVIITEYGKDRKVPETHAYTPDTEKRSDEHCQEVTKEYGAYEYRPGVIFDGKWTIRPDGCLWNPEIGWHMPKDSSEPEVKEEPKVAKKKEDKKDLHIDKPACEPLYGVGVWKEWTNCVGTYTYANGDKYVGEFKDGKHHGQGTYTYSDGAKYVEYVGEYKDGKRHGQGTFTYANGDKYVGEYKDDKRNGQGTYTYPDGDKYVGEHKDGKYHGQGTYTFGSGDKYVGEFKDNKYHGQGTFTYADGDKYVGEHKDGKYHGQGTYTWASGKFAGDKYVGEYKDDKRNGQGTMTYADGDKYVGEYKDDKRNGQGTMTHADGAKYVGEYKDGKRHGQGTYTYPDGAKYVGEFKDGKYQGKETVITKKKKKQKKKQEKDLHIDKPTETAGVRGKDKLDKKIKRDKEPPLIDLKEKYIAESESFNLKGKLIDKSPISKFEVDGINYPFDKKGEFNISLYVPLGGKTVHLKAIDKWNNKASKEITIARIDTQEKQTLNLSKLNPLSIKGKKDSNRLAIIIGIAEYESVPKATFANRDAQFFYDFAKSSLGISKNKIKLLVNDKADLKDILKTFSRWLRVESKKGKSDIYVFFAGHGLATPDGKQMYLLPHDGDTSLLNRTAVSRKEMIDAVKAVEPKSATFFFDTCYSGFSREGEMLIADARPVRFVVREEDIPSNFSILSAAKVDQISSGLKDINHGLFSYFLMKGLEGEADYNKDQQITLSELYSFTKEKVEREAVRSGKDQTPELQGNGDTIIAKW